MTATWRKYWILPLWSNYRTEAARDFYAPDLDAAFSLARAYWPSAKAWECTF